MERSAGDARAPSAPPADAAQPGMAGDPEGGEIDIAAQRLARPTAVMAVGTALSRVTGMGRVIAMAFALGVAESRLADSYNLANTLPNVVYELVLGGVLTSVFIPVVVEQLRTHERDDAWRAASAMVSVSLVVLLALTAVTIAAAPLIIDLFTARAEGAGTGSQEEVATFFLRVFAPQVALYGFAAIAAGLLNAHGRFALPMFAPILNNLLVIGVFLGFAALVSGVPTNEGVSASADQKLLLGLGTTGGVAAMALIYWPFLRRLPGSLRVNVDFRHPAVIKLARLSAWTLLYVVLNTIGFGVSFYLAGEVQGGVTAYVTAFAFFQLPIGLAAVSITTALVPKLSAHYVDGERDSFRTRVAGGLRATALLLVPATAMFVVLAHPMIETLLEHGVVGGTSVDLVSEVLVFFAMGLLPFSAYLLLMRAFYTRQDARTPALINVVENAATVALDFALFPSLGVKGLALAHTLGYVIGTAIAGWVLARRIGGLELRRTGRELGKAVAAAGASAAAMLGTVAALGGVQPGLDLQAPLELVAGGAVGVAVFVAAAWALRAEDLAMFRQLLPGRWRAA